MRRSDCRPKRCAPSLSASPARIDCCTFWPDLILLLLMKSIKGSLVLAATYAFCACFVSCKKELQQASVESSISPGPINSTVNLPWVRRTDKTDIAIVFVHGLFGDARSTWTNVNTHKFWPEMLTKDQAFDGANIYCYEYRTPKTGPALTVAELAGNMYVLLKEDGVLEHRKIFFIAHSMGGILTRQLLLDHNDPDLIGRIKLLYFYGVPSTGSQLATFFDFFSKNPQVLQLRPIKRDNMLGDQMNRWINQRFPFPTYAAYETQPTHGLPVVPFDGALFGSSSSTAIDGGHLDLARPADERAMSYILFRQAYRVATAALINSSEKIVLKPDQLFSRAATIEVDSDITMPDGAIILANQLEICSSGILRGKSITVLAQQIVNGRIIADGGVGRDGLLGEAPDGSADKVPESGERGGKITIYTAQVQNTAVQALGGVGGRGAKGRNGKDGAAGADGQNGDCRPFGAWRPAHPGDNGGNGQDGANGAERW